jgi:alpha-maltose-1-phosphate synthase
MASVLVSHPHAAPFATGAAAGFARAGRLSGYFTGIAAAPGGSAARVMRVLSGMLPVAHNRLLHGLSPRDLLSLAPLELSARVLARLAVAAGFAGPSAYDAMFLAHDAAVSVLPWPRRTDIVYAYEDAALLTFERAGRKGVERVWHLPIPHYATLEKMWIEESDRWPGAMGERPPIEPEWKKRRKDAEMRLADRISVPSRYTAESLERAGAKVPIVVTPFGFPVDEFPRKERDVDGPFTVIAVGTQDLRKGTPYLLEAWRRAGLKDARLRLLGAMKLTKRFMDRYADLFEHVPHVPRARITLDYRSADLLVLPTLGDGCPLVVQEAMCSSTAVVTTRCGNGPDFITDGVDGWVIPERDIDALVERLRAAARDRDGTRAVGRAARKRAERWTWTQVGDALSNDLNGR